MKVLNGIFSFRSDKVAPEERQPPSLRPLSTTTELIRLRWVAVFGQLVTIGVAAFALKIRLPVTVLFSIVGFTAISNLFFHQWLLGRENSENWIPGILILDIFLFAGLLGFSGGVENPFATFYLVHLAIGAMILRGRLLWIFLTLIASSFILLCFWFRPLHQPYTHAGKLDIHLHLQGTFISLFLSGCCIAWFMVQLSKALRLRELALVKSELKSARQKQLMHLATLAGGVAHELNTPLGTIALVAGEIHASLQYTNENPELREDVELIRSEVERCRYILDKLNFQSTQSVGAPPEVIHTAELPRRVLAEFPAYQRERIRIRVPSNDLAIYQPIEPVVQSLTTLIKNGLEASESKGDAVVLEIRQNRQMVEFEAWNSGPPISDEIKKRMGEIFFSTKKQHHGMGLGLFLVSSFAESAGGHIQIRSDAEQGTRITMVLPIESSLSGEGES